MDNENKDNVLVYAIVFLVSSKKNLHVFFTSLMFIFTCYKIEYFF